MNTGKHLYPRAAGVAAILLLSLATTALAGPPWLSIELPANPYDRLTRGAIALVRTYYHGGPVQLQVRATAEGLIDGERVSLPLELVPASATGLYALRGELPEEGTWVLVVRGGAEGGQVTAIVDVGPDGTLRGVDVPTRGDNPPIPLEVTAEDIDARLRSLASAGGSQLVLANAGEGTGPWPVAGLAVLGLAGAGIWRFRRR
jgi:MYXO-CTERM domain-containing protein